MRNNGSLQGFIVYFQNKVVNKGRGGVLVECMAPVGGKVQRVIVGNLEKLGLRVQWCDTMRGAAEVILTDEYPGGLDALKKWLESEMGKSVKEYHAIATPIIQKAQGQSKKPGAHSENKHKK